MDHIVSKITAWVTENYPSSDKEKAVTGETPLLQSGLIDSVGFLQLVSFLEEEFDFTFDPDDLTPENFDTPATIAHLVDSNLKALG